MLLHNLPDLYTRHLGGLVEGKLLNAGDVILRWNSAPAPTDRNLEATYVAPIAATSTISALIHWVQMRTVQRGFTEFEAGDAIITFEAAVDLTPQDLVFELPDGKIYVQASVGKKLTEFWDVCIGGLPLSRTLLLRLKA